MEERSGTDCSATLQQTTWYMNGAGVRAEKVVAGATTTWKDYLFAGGLMVGQRDTVVGGATTIQYFVLDHLGSVAVVLISSGGLQTNGRLSYDAWGNRRLTNGSDGTPAAAPTTRGFTGHEMIDAVGLVNMNGRVYDPFIGRFMSADPVTEDTFAMQMLNHYSYTYNNPLSYTDMTGHGLGQIFKAILAIAVAIVAWYVIAPAIMGLQASTFSALVTMGHAGAIGTGAIVMGVAGGISGAITTGSLQGALLGALQGAVTVGMGGSMGSALGTALSKPIIGNAITQGLVGGMFSVAGGGKFASGFLAAGVGSLGGALPVPKGPAMLVKNAVLGGAASVLGGGKFANGAMTAAFSYIATSIAENGMSSSTAGDGVDITGASGGQSATDEPSLKESAKVAWLTSDGIVASGEATLGCSANLQAFCKGIAKGFMHAKSDWLDIKITAIEGNGGDIRATTIMPAACGNVKACVFPDNGRVYISFRSVNVVKDFLNHANTWLVHEFGHILGLIDVMKWTLDLGPGA